MSTSLEPSDRAIPSEYKGELTPNYYCRAWNPKRQKYCRARAGQNTDHLGMGRCWMHFGNAPIKHGRYSTTVRDSLADHLDQIEAEDEESRLNILPEADMIRALARDFIERYEELRDALVAWNVIEMAEATEERRAPKPQPVPSIHDAAKLLDTAANIVDKIHKQRSSNAISRTKFRRLVEAMANEVREEVLSLEGEKLDISDLQDSLARIEQRWREIKL